MITIMGSCDLAVRICKFAKQVVPRLEWYFEQLPVNKKFCVVNMSGNYFTGSKINNCTAVIHDGGMGMPRLPRNNTERRKPRAETLQNNIYALDRDELLTLLEYLLSLQLNDTEAFTYCSAEDDLCLHFVQMKQVVPLEVETALLEQALPAEVEGVEKLLYLVQCQSYSICEWDLNKKKQTVCFTGDNLTGVVDFLVREQRYRTQLTGIAEMLLGTLNKK